MSEPAETTHYDPDAYRMTIGEHLEELRRRLIFSLFGFLIAAAVCLWFGRDVMSIFCAPLVNVLEKYDLTTQLFSDELQDVFMSFIEISLISAGVLSAPWIVYQLWQFIASGLYPHERKYITRYVPLSIGLLMTGMLFVYFLVLPWTLEFFVAFSIGVPQPTRDPPAVVINDQEPTKILRIAGNPTKPQEGQLWYDTTQKRLKFFIGGKAKVISFSAENLVATEYKLPAYVDLVVGMLVTFGLSFQLPLVVMALAKVGIVDIKTLKSSRKYVYFALAIVSAAITPGDAITATIGLMVPLCLLYELGILLAGRGAKPADADDD